MDYINTSEYGGLEHSNKVDYLPPRCPYCDRTIHPNLRYAITFVLDNGNEIPPDDILEAIFQCPSPDCQHLFIAQYLSSCGHPSGVEYFFAEVLPKGHSKKIFDEYIEKLSPSFCSLWNQSNQAEASDLRDICGAGYRKAL